MQLDIQLTGTDVLAGKTVSFRRKYAKALLYAIRRAVRRDLTKVRKAIRKESGIGRTIWGKSGKSLSSQVKEIRERVSEGGSVLETGIQLKGLAKLIEQGGRTKEHTIESQKTRRLRQAKRFENRGRVNTAAFLRGLDSRGFLVFTVGGKLVFARKVKHRGSTIRAHGIAARIFNISTRAAAEREIAISTDKLMKETFGG